MSLQISVADLEGLLLNLPHPNTLDAETRERYWRIAGAIGVAQQVARNAKPTHWRLVNIGAGSGNKVPGIKALRSIMELGLKEAKDLIEVEPFHSEGVTQWIPMTRSQDLIRKYVREAQVIGAASSFHVEFRAEKQMDVPVEVKPEMEGTW
jgi:hypothetical protein